MDEDLTPSSSQSRLIQSQQQAIQSEDFGASEATDDSDGSEQPEDFSDSEDAGDFDDLDEDADKDFDDSDAFDDSDNPDNPDNDVVETPIAEPESLSPLLAPPPPKPPVARKKRAPRKSAKPQLSFEEALEWNPLVALDSNSPDLAPIPDLPKEDETT